MINANVFQNKKYSNTVKTIDKKNGGKHKQDSLFSGKPEKNKWGENNH